ncbi:MAG: methyltransferase domain-containing protein [Pygmaiobacter massiliensis]|nr:methyltransferase domain-containing protein [Pygmaiobacter massiliensis]
MQESFFCCPICKGVLKKENGALRCQNRHSFDLAKEGYANLLPVNRKHSSLPGDDKQMVLARRRFLERGFYAAFADMLCQLAQKALGESKNAQQTLLDAGCGEGYYTGCLAQSMPRVYVAGFDISKAAVRSAAKRVANVEFAVASSFSMPVRTASVSCLTNVFAPVAQEEFARVVCPGGVFLYAVPGPRHLWELKQVLYSTPYENEQKEVAYFGFQMEKRVPVRGEICLENKQQIQDLFAMTPYYWKTPQQGAQKLAQLETLKTQIAFDFLVYRRKER